MTMDENTQGCVGCLMLIVGSFVLAIAIALWQYAIAIALIIMLVVVLYRRKHPKNSNNSNTQKQNKQVTSRKGPSSLRTNSFDKISEDILPLLYFKNGNRKNVNIDSPEPSAIDVELPIRNKAPEPTGYYPSYSGLTPEQRFCFINWLQRLDKISDMGYPFLLLYCLERHIYEDTYVDSAVSLIKRMQLIFDNKSFSYYSSSAIVWATQRYSNPDYLTGVDTTKLPTEVGLFVHIYQDRKVSPEFLMNNSRQLGWTNQRYIKNYPELFKKELIKILNAKYNLEYLPFDNNIDTSKINSVPLILSNYSLPMEERTIQLPNFLSIPSIQVPIVECLKDAHEGVKQYLKENPNLYKTVK